MKQPENDLESGASSESSAPDEAISPYFVVTGGRVPLAKLDPEPRDLPEASSPQIEQLQRNLAESHARLQQRIRVAAPVASPEPLSEREIEFLESQIPAMAEAATRSAFWSALTRGRSVVCACEEQLVETHPDGTQRTIETLPARGHLPRGTEIILR